MDLHFATDHEFNHRFIITIEQEDDSHSRLTCHYATAQCLHPDLKNFDATGKLSIVVDNNFANQIRDEQVFASIPDIENQEFDVPNINIGGTFEEVVSMHETPIMNGSLDEVTLISGVISRSNKVEYRKVHVPHRMKDISAFALMEKINRNMRSK